MYGPLLDSQVPLKSGEKHCLFCSGYGALPINKQDPHRTLFVPERCSYCEGSGKDKR